MPIYYNSQGNRIKLTDEIGRGGEGTVHLVSHDETLVAKTYHEAISPEKAAKLRWMAEQKTESLLKIAAWVVDTLHELPGGQVVGFLMPSVKAKEIHDLYSVKSRRSHYPDADWRFLIHAAMNLARAFHSVHAHGHVIGDMNQKNFVVLPNGTIKLMDCDSYQIKAEEKLYPCEVGTATHVSPELQGSTVRGITRLANHDNFGLAVIIFQLLFLGRHPYSGNYLGQEDKSLEDCIKEYRFAYGKDAASRQVRQPPGTLMLEAVSLPVASLFEKAFLNNKENRPEPREWIVALEELSKNLDKCEKNPSHYHLKTLENCPWCLIENQSGLVPFSINFGQLGADENVNIFTLENFLKTIKPPQNLVVIPSKPLDLPKPSRDIQRQKHRFNKRLLGVIAVQFGITLILLLFNLEIGFIFSGAIASFIFCFLYLCYKNNPIEMKASLKFREELSKWEQVENEWRNTNKSSNVSAQITSVKTKIAEFKALPQLRQQKLLQLEEKRHQNQLNEYLDQFRIESADIAGVGKNRKGILDSYGIETAADIDASRLSTLPGFGPAYTQKFIDWRESLEADFVFNPRKPVSTADRQKVETDIANLRHRSGREIQQSIARIQQQTTNVDKRFQYLHSISKSVGESLAQAESNYQAVSRTGFTVGALLLSSFAMFIFGMFFKFAVWSPMTPAKPYISNPDSSYNEPPPALKNNGATMTDKEIAAINEDGKKAIANYLYNQGTTLSKDGKYDEAIAKFKEAVRYDKKDDRILYAQGYAHYKLGEYSDAVDSLQEAREIDPTNIETKELLALNYIQMNEWQNAEDIYRRLINNKHTSYSIYYNLGLARNNLKDFFLATPALKAAIEIRPAEAGAHYELGRSYVGLKDFRKAQQEVETLKKLNVVMAGKLQEQIKIK